MKTLKILVIVMGVLILLGTSLLVYLVVQRSKWPQFVNGSVMLPAKAKIIETVAFGNLLVLRFRLPNDEEQLLVLDPVTGKISSKIALRTEP